MTHDCYKKGNLQSKRLTYSLVCEHDEHDIVVNISKDVLINIGSYPWPYTLKEAKQFIQDCQRVQERHARYDYTIKDRQNTFIGIISLHLVPDKNGDEPGMIGYWITPSKRRQGYAFEAVGTILKLAKKLNFNMVWARIRYDNLSSIALIHKVGFIFHRESFGTYDNKRLPARIYVLSLENNDQCK